MSKKTAKQKRNLMKLHNLEPKPETYTKEQVMEFAERIITSYVANTMITLRDGFGFGKVRLERFLDRESNNAQAMKEGYVSVDDILKVIKDETGLDFIEFVKEKSQEQPKQK